MALVSDSAPGTIRIPYDRMEEEFYRVLVRRGFSSEKARICAHVFADNTLEGVATHGVNRFPRFIHYVINGFVQAHAEPINQHRAGSVEQWDGNLGPGILNALFCTNRAMELAKEQGIGCVGLRNTNHWMRGGTYAWKAARAGFLFLGWTNTIANMPAWGAKDCRLGNNPFVIGVPFNQEAVVLDMAMSQYSYGSMEAHKSRGLQLPQPGGYDAEGNLTTDPSAILQTHRALPIGYWKGSGLALLLDILATLLSGGESTAEVGRHEVEYSLSQVFIAIDISQLGNRSTIAESINSILMDFKNSTSEEGLKEVLYPGERVVRTREVNLKNGIPVDKEIWAEILKL